MPEHSDSIAEHPRACQNVPNVSAAPPQIPQNATECPQSVPEHAHNVSKLPQPVPERPETSRSVSRVSWSVPECSRASPECPNASPARPNMTRRAPKHFQSQANQPRPGDALGVISGFYIFTFGLSRMVQRRGRRHGDSLIFPIGMIFWICPACQRHRRMVRN